MKLIVAYNIDFDWHFISKALEKNDFDFENDTPELRCCMKKFSEIYGESIFSQMIGLIKRRSKLR